MQDNKIALKEYFFRKPITIVPQFILNEKILLIELVGDGVKIITINKKDLKKSCLKQSKSL